MFMFELVFEFEYAIKILQLCELEMKSERNAVNSYNARSIMASICGDYFLNGTHGSMDLGLMRVNGDCTGIKSRW